MARNDAILYSGSSSVTRTKASVKIAEKKKQERKETDIKKSYLQPVEEIIYQLLEIDEKNMGEILLGIIDGKDNDEQIKATLMAIRMHRKWIGEFRQRLAVILRPNENKENTDD